MVKTNANEVSVSDSDIPSFKELKTVQIATLLAKRSGGKIDLYKLIKLIYLIDRRALEKHGYLVTFDRPFNMNFGPIMSNAYNLARGKQEGEYWSKYFSYSNSKRTVVLENHTAGNKELCESEIELINEVFNEFGNMSFQQLKDYTHSLPEYEDVGSTSKEIQWLTFFNVTGWHGEDLLSIKDEMHVKIFYDKLLNME